MAKCQRRAVTQKGARREFTQLRFADGQRQTRIAACYGVANSVAFAGVKEQRLVGLGYGLLAPNMPHVDAAIWKHQFCSSRELFLTLVTAAAAAVQIPDANDLRFQ